MKVCKLISAIFLSLILSGPASAQILEPVKFKAALEKDGTETGRIVFTGTIDPGWHVYSTGLGDDGPTSATFNAETLDGVELDGDLTPEGNEIDKFDEVFGMKLRYFENTVRFVQKIRFTKPEYKIDSYLEYGACNDSNCLPPTSVDFVDSGVSPAVGDARNAAAPDTQSVAGGDAAELVQNGLWAPVADKIQAITEGASGAGRSIWYLLLMGFLGGLLAILMPCIWPIIPMTVSFFMRRSEDKRRSRRDAILYGVSIIVIYLVLGVGITLIFGGNKLNELSTNAVFNIFLFVLLVVFALSFFGWFEIKLPSKWNNAVDSKAGRTTGIISIFLMAFTLVLVSFSCTAPIIGLLLAEMSTTGNVLGPIVGMFGFSFAFALVFSLFALFPGFMKKLPKSGSWMTKIQVVLAFIELAFAFKFLSVADLAYGWHILDREVFLSIWIVIFALLGAYLVGWLKFPVDEIGGDLHKPASVPSIMLGMCSFVLAVYMIPGLWGAPCTAVSAFAPPLYTQDFNLNRNEVRAAYHDYEQGMAAAAAAGKPVLLDFTGYGCVNCRKIEAEVWTDPSVARRLNDDYVLISLFVDDKTPLSAPLKVTENGRELTLRTVGDKWSYLQRYKFGSNAQPFYIAVTPEGNPLTGSYGFDKSISAYLDFLDSGLKAYKQ
ncbi:MAG: thioredoxin family protein [Bacteroidales bacterium]|nr:thioredoxin family protein [Bacteroidales bacterium]